jgi:hypothetical protein
MEPQARGLGSFRASARRPAGMAQTLTALEQDNVRTPGGNAIDSEIEIWVPSVRL